jgi:hypothetical protein
MCHVKLIKVTCSAAVLVKLGEELMYGVLQHADRSRGGSMLLKPGSNTLGSTGKHTLEHSCRHAAAINHYSASKVKRQ